VSGDAIVTFRETKTAHIGVVDGTVIVRIRADVTQSLDDARENLSAALDATAGRRMPLLIDIQSARPLEAEVRHHYSGQQLVDGFAALGLLVDASPLGRMIGNVYLRIARPGIPTRLFVDEASALDWLSGYRT